MTDLDNEARVWVEEAVAGLATQTGPGYETARICEDVSSNKFFPTFLAATLADKLPVKGLLGSHRWGKLVFVPLQQLGSDFGIKLLEDRHVVEVQRVGA